MKEFKITIAGKCLALKRHNREMNRWVSTISSASHHPGPEGVFTPLYGHDHRCCVRISRKSLFIRIFSNDCVRFLWVFHFMTQAFGSLLEGLWNLASEKRKRMDQDASVSVSKMYVCDKKTISSSTFLRASWNEKCRNIDAHSGNKAHENEKYHNSDAQAHRPSAPHPYRGITREHWQVAAEDNWQKSFTGGWIMRCFRSACDNKGKYV